MGIDNDGVRESAPISAVELHNKIPLGDEIKNIFNEKQSPLETLKKIAGLIKESDSRHSSKSTPETSTTPIQIEDIDQQETDKKIVQIREQLGSLEIKPKVETILPSEKRCLFPPKKSLLEEHSDAFKKEKHTAIGMVHYLQDIVELKKLGIPKATRYYGAMRARGFHDGEVIDSAKSLMTAGIDLNQLPKAIDRFHMTVGEKYRLDTYTDYQQEVKDISTVDDQQFQKNFEQLNKYSFLESAKGSYSSEFVEILKNGIPSESELFLDHINQLCSNIPIDHLEDIVSSYSGGGLVNSNFNINSFTSSLENIYKNYCQSEFSSDKPLSIPEDILSKLDDSYYSRKFNNLNNLHDLDQQKFFLNLRNNSDYLFNYNHTANSEFYLKYYSSSFNTEKPLNLPQDILSTFDEQDQKIWQGILNIKDIEYQKFFLDYFENHSNSKYFNINFFNNDYQPTSLFFDKCIGYKPTSIPGENSFFKSTLTPELIQTFSPEDQKFWNCFLNINYLDQYHLHYFINNNKTNLDRLFNENNQPKSTFFREYITYNDFDKNFNANNFLQTDLTPEVMETFSPEDQKFWNTLVNLKSDDHGINNFIVKNKDRFDEFFNNNGQLNSVFFEQFIKNDLSFSEDSSLLKLLTPETLQSFSPEDQKFWNTLVNLKSDDCGIKYFIVKNRNRFDEFFNNKGQPTSRFFEQFIKDSSLFSEGSSHLKLLTPETLQSFNPEDQKIWSILVNLKSNDNEINEFIFNSKEKILQKIKSPEQLDQYIAIINQINSSPSKEILKIKGQLLIEILNNDNPLEAYQKISDIFIKNNLPMVGKIYRVFESLYPPKKVKEILEENHHLSPVLINNSSPHLRQKIIFNDLLQINLGSGEQSLVNYLNLFQTSSPLLEKSRSGENLNQTESFQLSTFFKKLDTLYDSSLLSRIQSTKTLDTSTLQLKISELYQKYKVKENQSISDRVSEMYLSSLGINSITEAINYSNQIRESAHQRNLTRTDFSLAPGDLVKSVSSNNIDNILNFGCVSREYLGVDSDSDATPFDTDVIRSNSTHSAQEISSIGANGYGDLFIIVKKDREQFQNTTEITNPKYDSSKLEVFYSGIVSENHYGVRTGFSSSEIDFLVTTDTDPQKLANIYFQISSHGVYIPIIDTEGKLLFTPENYEKYKLNTESISQTLSESNFVPEKLIDSLKNVPYLEKLYEMDSGVGEGYSVGQHTQMVMGQFEKYFSEEYQPTILNLEDFRLLLSLHDIGKGEAVAQTGHTNEQHVYTQKIAKNILSQSGVSEKSSDIIIGLIDQDILGEYFKGNNSIEVSSKKIIELSEKIDISVTDLIDTLKMFYICDAGSYTSDAGGITSLDRLFSFNPTQKKVSFSESTETKYQELIKVLF